MRTNRSLVGVRRILDAIDHVRFKRLTLFNEFFHALGVHIFLAGESLEVAGLPAGFIAHAAPRQLGHSAKPARPQG